MNGAVTVAKMEPRGSCVSPLRTRKRSRTLRLRKTTHGSRSGRSIGRAECRETKIGIEPKGSTFFLTFPSIGHRYRVESRGSGAENKMVTARTFIRFRGPQALRDMDESRSTEFLRTTVFNAMRIVLMSRNILCGPPTAAPSNGTKP